MAGTKWEVGQAVVLTSGYALHEQSLVRIKKVWKNGVAEIMSLDPDEQRHRGRTFNENGRERGDHGYHTAYIYPLKDGETEESFLAAQKAATKKKQQERATAEQEKQAAIDTWWKAEGERFWNNALEMNTRLDLPDNAKAYFMQWKERGEQKASIVVVHLHTDMWTKKPVVSLYAGGMQSRKYKSTDGPKFSLSGFGSSSIEAPTFIEALYRLTH